MVTPSPLVFPLTVPQTARSGTVKLHLQPRARYVTVGHPPTRTWRLFAPRFPRTGTVKLYTPPSYAVPRPTYGQLWPRGTRAGPPA